MSVSVEHRTAATGSLPVAPRGLARLGQWAATHLRTVLLLWLAVVAVLGAFAPRVESALSGAGWQDSTSQSVQARAVIARDFSGLGATALQVLVHDSNGPIAADPAARKVIARASTLLQADPRVSVVIA
ncbi:MAG: MMPL family transporter, partial [Actinobacteria bacterium]|nr:MMPL family transporter [Actinomycetota bacterium]